MTNIEKARAIAAEPKLCPFCGEPAKLIHPMGERLNNGPPYYGPDGSRYVCSSFYMRPSKPCPGREVSFGPDQDEDALTAWNTRAKSLEAEKLADTLRVQTGLVERLTDAVEREMNDIGGEGSLTVLREMGPSYEAARAALAAWEGGDV